MRVSLAVDLTPNYQSPTNKNAIDLLGSQAKAGASKVSQRECIAILTMLKLRAGASPPASQALG